MQQPDADGFVNIVWPSRNVPHGGVFHSRCAAPTAAQREFLKVLIEEARFSNALRQSKDYRLRREDRGDEGKPDPDVHLRMPVVRPRTSKRRSLSAIRESGVYDDLPFKPLKRGEDREKLKDKLANTMAYGPEPDNKPPPPPRIAKPKPQLPTAKEKWNDLITQIRERADWLAEMEVLGHAEPHREIIKEQIAERLRALDALGIDSECSSARSGFSTTRSREILVPIARSNGSAQSKGSKGSAKSIRSNKSADLSIKGEPIKSADSQGRPKLTKSSPKCSNRNKEENVSSYECTLKYSPRRRV
ncbi:hypothetical protein NE865_12410 [Phthorimaea operculella]|nr:hypothetical protein NE865_12410 [Phthorimaea operculella]